jgi:hypothetical protein
MADPGSQDAEQTPLPRLVIEDSALDPTSQIWYALPGGFVDIPLAALAPEPGTEGEQRLEQAMALVLEATPGAVRDRYLGALRDVHAMARYMQREGVIGCSMGMHLADDGSGALSVFTVALRDIEWAPPKLTALRAVAERQSAQNIAALVLAGGHPASVADTVVPRFSAPGLPPQDLYQCNVYVPDPAGARLAILTLSTTAVGVRSHYRQMMEGIAYTVSFVDPMPEIERAVRGEGGTVGSDQIKDQIASDFG